MLSLIEVFCLATNPRLLALKGWLRIVYLLYYSGLKGKQTDCLSTTFWNMEILEIKIKNKKKIKKIIHTFPDYS